MDQTLARTLKETVEFVAGLVTDANPALRTVLVKVANPAAAAAAATETAAAFLIKILVKTAVVSGRMVHAVSPLSASGAATLTTVAATSARMKAAHGIAARNIAVWCAETLTITATCARGVDTVIGTVRAQTVAAELAKSSPVTSLTILAKKCARTVPILSAIGKTATNVATWTIAKKRR